MTTARRGWLTSDRVINTWPSEKLLAWLDERDHRRGTTGRPPEVHATPAAPVAVESDPGHTKPKPAAKPAPKAPARAARSTAAKAPKSAPRPDAAAKKPKAAKPKPTKAVAAKRPTRKR